MVTKQKFVREVTDFLDWSKFNGRNFAHGYYVDAHDHGTYMIGETATGDLCLFSIDERSAGVYQAVGWTDADGFFAGKTLDELIEIALRGDAKLE